MNYIVHKRFKDTAMCGEINLPAKTKLKSTDGVIVYNGSPICRETSENAHQFFARDDDGHGMERGRLTQAIMKTLAKRNGRDDPEHQARWDKVWVDPVCQQYKRPDYTDYWLWGHNFYQADINDLRHIAKLVGAKA